MMASRNSLGGHHRSDFPSLVGCGDLSSPQSACPVSLIAQLFEGTILRRLLGVFGLV